MPLRIRTVARGAVLVLGIAAAILLGIVAQSHDPRSARSTTPASAEPSSR